MKDVVAWSIDTYQISIFLDDEDGLDQGIHLMHISASPHYPHADCCDQHRHTTHPNNISNHYFWLADLWLGLLFIPTYMWKATPAIKPRKRKMTLPISRPVYLLIYLYIVWKIYFLELCSHSQKYKQMWSVLTKNYSSSPCPRKFYQHLFQSLSQNLWTQSHLLPQRINAVSMTAEQLPNLLTTCVL